MLLSVGFSFGGLILDSVVDVYHGFAIFQPIINGIGGNLVSVQASRTSTMLHQSSIMGILPPHAKMLVAPWTALFTGCTCNYREYKRRNSFVGSVAITRDYDLLRDVRHNIVIARIFTNLRTISPVLSSSSSLSFSLFISSLLYPCLKIQILFKKRRFFNDLLCARVR